MSDDAEHNDEIKGKNSSKIEGKNDNCFKCEQKDDTDGFKSEEFIVLKSEKMLFLRI